MRALHRLRLADRAAEPVAAPRTQMTGARTPSSSPTPAATPGGGRRAAGGGSGSNGISSALSAAEAAQFKKILRALVYG
jgi:hypothetical protein